MMCYRINKHETVALYEMHNGLIENPNANGEYIEVYILPKRTKTRSIAPIK